MSDDGAQLEVLRDGSAELSFVRLPVDRDGLHVIPLYEEQPVVVAPKATKSRCSKRWRWRTSRRRTSWMSPRWAGRRWPCRWWPRAPVS
ncbi:LysR substrate-binding domain-containing protein [Arthrobacter sp. Hiyo1]|uniref:LysR substrate-binding domain-containing protein n=1 Tax=Arthrobacter sp. Hiyo1 TaxID=1588020 RepID=UPI0040401DFE